MNVIATTATDTLSSPLATRNGTARKLVGLAAAAVVVAASVTVTVAQQSGHSPAHSVTTVAQLEQARAAKADRLLDRVDATGTADPAVLAQIHQVTGASAAAQQARTVLYQELRNG